MIEAILWGLVQGLTEFLPVSSSGHLVLVPSLVGSDAPTLATSAVLHLGTLAAVVGYFRKDLLALTDFRHNAQSRKTVGWLALGSLPASVGLFVRGGVETLQRSTTAVSVALITTGLVLWISSRFATGERRIADMNRGDAIAIGFAQAAALIPGISRSGMTIAAGLGLKMDRSEAARFSFLLGVPAIAAAGLLEMGELINSGGGVDSSVWVGVVVAAISGYAAIAFLLRVLTSRGLKPFAYYAILAGIVGLVVL